MIEHAMWFGHGYSVYDEIVRVPLLLRGPRVAAGRFDGSVSGIDVAATILAFAGAPPPTGSVGIDLRGGRIPKDRFIFTEAMRGQHFRAVVQDKRKWVLQMPIGEARIVESHYYDLETDAGELSPITELPDAPAFTRLKALVASDPDPGGMPPGQKQRMRKNAPKVSPRANEQQLEQLKGLGYVE
jgi:arylsulfatase A-like enzyme